MKIWRSEKKKFKNLCQATLFKAVIFFLFDVLFNSVQI